MINIDALFKNKTLDEAKLIDYGFAHFEEVYVKSFPILEGQYFVKICISTEGKGDFLVFETDNNEEYLPAQVYNATGAFVGEIHEACEEIFRDISEKCYYTERFQSEQSKRILQFIKERFHAEPEYLWSKIPDFAALRVPGKKPWFAVLGKVPKEKFGLEDEGIVEIINLKDEPQIVSSRIDGINVFPAYHMNKKHWYSLFLDGRLTDTEIQSMIEKSYSLVSG